MRVANHWVSDDQSHPPALASSLTRRDDTLSQVHILEIDDDFEKISGLSVRRYVHLRNSEFCSLGTEMYHSKFTLREFCVSVPTDAND